MKTIRTKRIYEKPYDQDGYRILVDRIWPRGVSKQAARLDEWKKEIAPSDELRKWFDHDPEKFDEFSKKYREELKEKKELLENVREVAKENRITLVYAAKDEKNNQAVVLKNILEGN